MPKVIVGMSGGVDSSVTAYLLKERGYEVEGLSFLMYEEKSGATPTCCSYKSMDKVSNTAHHLGISHSIIDVRNDFTEKVIEPFVNAYLSGYTPNPCILCNRFIKFPSLMKEAEKRGAEYIATGHYARVEPAESKEQGAKSENNSEHLHNDYFFLKKGIDPKKDQSYVLYVLRQEELKRLILPLGYHKKEEVRKIAQKLDLPAAASSESQEICFIEDRKYFKFIEKLSPVVAKPGLIADLNGKTIGTHRGIYGYTIGQRKGMGISSQEPLYVVKIDVMNNTIYTGPREAAKKREFFVGDINWITSLIPPLIGGDEKGLNFRASVKVRSTMKDEQATISMTESEEQGAVRVVFDEPQWAPAPGQSAVFYNGDMVLGGGIIR